MTAISEARRRSTDQMVDEAMKEAGNSDPSKIAESARPLHYDSFDGLDAHRSAMRPTDRAAGYAIGEAALGKVASFAADFGVDKAVGWVASAAARGAVGATWQVTSSAVLAYHLYAEGYEKPHREKDLQRALGANDAGVVGLAHALPFDDTFKGAVAAAHAGSGNAAARVTSSLQAAEHRADLAELTLRAERGLVDAAPLARAVAHDLAACMKGAASAADHAKAARARGDNTVAANFEERASAAVARAAELENKALAPVLARARADAAYGLGVQSAVHHALRVELGKETADHFRASVAKAQADLATVEPAVTTVRG